MDRKRGIMLDVGCGRSKQPGFIGINTILFPGVDIVHDIEVFPYPIVDNDCLTIVCSQVIEHIKPWLTVPFMNELWRIMKPGGQLAITTPYAGSAPFWEDPTHCNGFTDETFWHFDPRSPRWKRHQPKPWQIAAGFPVWQVTGNIEVLMRKMAEVPDGGM